MRLYFEKLHIFTVAGGVLTFVNGEIIKFNNSVLVFVHEFEPDGDIQQANFWVKQICGYSLVEKQT